MPPVDFGFFSARSRDSQAGDYRLVNGYAEAVRGGKPDLMIWNRPGFTRWDSASFAGINRGMVAVRNKGLYCVLGNELVRFIDDSSAVSLGAIGGSSSIGLAGGLGFVTMAQNMATEPELAIVTEDGIYYYVDTSTGTITEYAGANLDGAVSVDFLDGYFIFAQEDGKFVHSDINDASSIDALAFAFAESRPDGLQRIVAHRGAAIALGETSMEVFENAGTQPFAFAPIRSDIEIGLLARYSLARVQESLVWVDQHGQVQLMNGIEPQRISDHQLENQIAKLTDTQRRALRATYGYFEGHQFYILTSDLWTYAYDKTTGSWSEMSSESEVNLTYQNSAEFNREVIFGAADDGKLYTWSTDSHDDDGDGYTMIAQSAPVSFFPNGGIVDRLSVDMVRGVGDNDGDADAENPKVMLDWSTDGGKTFSGGRVAEIGRAGEYETRIDFNRLGAFGRNGIIFRLQSSSKVRRGIMRSDATIRPLATARR